MKTKIKRTITILLAVCFLVSVTATAVSAVPTPFPSIASTDNHESGYEAGLDKDSWLPYKLETLFMGVSTWDPSNRDK